MVLLVLLMDKVLLFLLYITLCSVDTWYILECISWYHFLFLATGNFSWLTWAFAVILDIPHLLDHGFSVKFSLIFSSCLEHKFFLLYGLFHHLSMLVLPLFLVFLKLVVSWYYSFISPLIMWFLLPLRSFEWLLLPLL